MPAAILRRPLSDRTGYALVVYGIFVLVATGTVPTGLFQDYAEELGFSPAVLALVAASTTFGVTIAVLAFGTVSDRVGRRPVILPAIAAGAGCLLLYLVVQGAVLFVAARTLSGFAVGLFTGAGTALLTELRPDATRRAATHAATASVAGFAVGPVIGAVFAEYLPWPLHLVYLVSLVLLLPALAGALLVRETVPDREPFALRLQRLRLPPARATFGLASMLAVCAWMSASFFGALGLVMAVRLFDVENRLVAVLAVFCFLGSSALAQMGLRGQPIRRSAVVGAGFLIGGFGLVVAGLASGRFVLFVVGALVGGVGQALSYLAGQSMVELVAPVESRGEVFSTYLVVVYYGGGTTAISLGIAARQIGLEPAAIGYAVILCALTAVTAALAARHRLPQRRG